ncbi:MAG: hypothetical protein KDC79_07780 [Cyclobacteriaceae bacterium]|nr:hypothetical protein [Cyclobacteriaceae bacterium]
MKKYIIIVVLAIVTQSTIFAQDDNLDRIKYSTDTVFILLEKSTFSRLEIGKGVYYNPDKSYPLDIGRLYTISVYSQSLGLKYNKTPYDFVTAPELKDSFYLEKPRKFLTRPYKDYNWFKENDFESIRKQFDGKVIMIVDPDFLSAGKFFVVRVFQNIGVN